MLYIIWALLNLALTLAFLAACYKLIKRLKEKIGLALSIVFVFGLLSSSSHDDVEIDNKEPGTNSYRKWEFHSSDSLLQNSTTFLDIPFEKTPFSKYELSITYGQDKNTRMNVPVNAYSFTSGLTWGTYWHPVVISLNETGDNKKFEYQVKGIIKWKLLGATLYSQAKTYNGIALLK